MRHFISSFRSEITSYWKERECYSSSPLGNIGSKFHCAFFYFYFLQGSNDYAGQCVDAMLSRAITLATLPSRQRYIRPANPSKTHLYTQAGLIQGNMELFSPHKTYAEQITQCVDLYSFVMHM